MVYAREVSERRPNAWSQLFGQEVDSQGMVVRHYFPSAQSLRRHNSVLGWAESILTGLLLACGMRALSECAIILSALAIAVDEHCRFRSFRFFMFAHFLRDKRTRVSG